MARQDSRRSFESDEVRAQLIAQAPYKDTLEAIERSYSKDPSNARLRAFFGVLS